MLWGTKRLFRCIHAGRQASGQATQETRSAVRQNHIYTKKKRARKGELERERDAGRYGVLRIRTVAECNRCTRTHTQMRARAHTRTHTFTHVLAHTPEHTCTRVSTHTSKHVQASTLKLANTNLPLHTRARTHAVSTSSTTGGGSKVDPPPARRRKWFTQPFELRNKTSCALHVG